MPIVSRRICRVEYRSYGKKEGKKEKGKNVYFLPIIKYSIRARRPIVEYFSNSRASIHSTSNGRKMLN